MTIILSASAPSNRDWVTQFYVVDGETGLPIDFSTAFVAIAIADSDGCTRISASTTDGKVTVLTPGYIQLSIPYTEMNLCAGSYQIGGYYQMNGDTIDLFEGTLAIRQGIPKP